MTRESASASAVEDAATRQRIAIAYLSVTVTLFLCAMGFVVGGILVGGLLGTILLIAGIAVGAASTTSTLLAAIRLRRGRGFLEPRPRQDPDQETGEKGGVDDCFALVSYSLRVVVAPGEEPAAGLSRRDNWPEGVYAYQSERHHVTGPTGDAAREAFSAILDHLVSDFAGRDELVALAASSAGHLNLRVTQGPRLAEFKLQDSFLRRWAEWNGSISVDPSAN